ncbi:MAG: TatD family hydrolase [Legionella sp.]|nr:TatD family hydrolase [Legionella sp.]
MLIDSHCHLNLLDLSDFNQNLSQVLTEAIEVGVEHFLCVCVELAEYQQLCEIAEKYPPVSISVGLHPNCRVENEPTSDNLVQLASHAACIAIGETGLDYYRTEDAARHTEQQSRFRAHIQAALTAKKPLIIHTRQASEDTLRILAEENAEDIGGVMHCFGEDWDVAKRALDLNFYISFSGIVTFKNAETLREVAKKVPLDRILIETDAPYLAPVPHRGKQNHPALVRHVAETMCQLREMDYEIFAKQTTDNFYRCFRLAQ